MRSEMIKWAKDLYPLPRSLTGSGTKETLKYIKNICPNFNELVFKSGQKVFDWTVPKEWCVTAAYIEHLDSGRRFADFSKNNLHLVGYSEAVDMTLSKAELKARVHTLPDKPKAIPYVTSYYSKTWGFCMSEVEWQSMPSGNYRVLIDSTLFDGELLLADCIIPGRNSEEIMFTSYICHPSMVNNELSGPVLIMALVEWLGQRDTQPNFTYRFVLAPETIGALCYLSRNLQILKENVICGINLSCVGDERAFSHVQSPYGDNLADKSLKAVLKSRKNIQTYSYLERGSDERQYCAPGIDLPFAGLCRSKYGTYPEYHTSMDNFEVVTEQGLSGSFDVCRELIDAFEAGLYPVCSVLGEPQLGKRGLYPNLSGKDTHQLSRVRMDLLAYSNGKNSIFDIAELINAPLDAAITELKLLSEYGLIKPSFRPEK